MAARAETQAGRYEEEERYAAALYALHDARRRSARRERIRSVNKDPLATLGECLPNALRR